MKRGQLVAWAMRCGVPVEWLESGQYFDPETPGGQGASHRAWNADVIELPRHELAAVA